LPARRAGGAARHRRAVLVQHRQLVGIARLDELGGHPAEAAGPFGILDLEPGGGGILAGQEDGGVRLYHAERVEGGARAGAHVQQLLYLALRAGRGGRGGLRHQRSGGELDELGSDPAGAVRGGRIDDPVPAAGAVLQRNLHFLAGIELAERGVAGGRPAADINFHGERTGRRSQGGRRGRGQRRIRGGGRLRMGGNGGGGQAGRDGGGGERLQRNAGRHQ